MALLDLLKRKPRDFLAEGAAGKEGLRERLESNKRRQIKDIERQYATICLQRAVGAIGLEDLRRGPSTGEQQTLIGRGPFGELTLVAEVPTSYSAWFAGEPLERPDLEVLVFNGEKRLGSIVYSGSMYSLHGAIDAKENFVLAGHEGGISEEAFRYHIYSEIKHGDPDQPQLSPLSTPPAVPEPSSREASQDRDF